MNLIVDTGNTFTKIALFDKAVMVDFERHKSDSAELKEAIQRMAAIADNAIISSVGKLVDESFFDGYSFNKLIKFSNKTPVPLKNAYKTPETLGSDRLAAAVGGWKHFPGRNILTIDAGTAITFDFTSANGTYHGGSISPGIRLRYRALNQFTERLPMLEPDFDPLLIGTDTKSSIHSGVMLGIAAETEGIINAYNEQYKDVVIILTGGDYLFFDKQLKIKKFALPNLILEGLEAILEYNK